MIGVGKQPNPNYEENIPSLNSANNGNDLLILNDLPRFA